MDPLGVYFDPEKLVEARASGLSFQEIHQKARAGEDLRGQIPQDIFLPEQY